jgi:hypothetical protein
MAILGFLGFLMVENVALPDAPGDKDVDETENNR